LVEAFEIFTLNPCNMNRHAIIAITLTILTCAGCRFKKEEQVIAEDTTTFHFDWKAQAGIMMQRMNLERGEKVLIIASPGRFDSLIAILQEVITRKGVYLGTISVDSAQWPASWQTEFTAGLENMDVASMTSHFKDIDLGIMMPGASIDHKPYKAMQQVLQSGKGRTIHFHWSGAYTMEGILMSESPEIDRHYQEALLLTDYRKLSALQQMFEEAARKGVVHVTTPQGTDVTFNIGDRPVTKQDGDASRGRTDFAHNLIDREIELPAGAIRVAPVEESVEGLIAFPDGVWNGKPVTGLVMTLHGGKVTDLMATTGLDAVKEELDAAGVAGYSFREFALGFNPLLAIPEGKHWIPYYGYGAGVVRLSLGDNTELGGKVKGDYVRWNFFTDATVQAGGMTMVKDGKMLQ
jgi:hypothetical protein